VLSSSLFRAKFRKLPLALAAVLDLLAGGFACYVGADPLAPFLAYTLGVAALYTERRQMLAVFVSFALSVYGAAVLRGEPVPLLIIAAVLKCIAPFFKGLLVLKSEVRGLVGVLSYFRENPLALFVFTSILLFTLAAVKLASNDSLMANRFSLYALYQLVSAVAVGFIQEARRDSSNGEKET
jgi:hypothetical protein